MVEDRTVIRKRKWLATVRGIVTHSAGGSPGWISAVQEPLAAGLHARTKAELSY